MALRLKFFLFLVLWGSVPALGRDPFVFPEARLKEVAQSAEWRKLLHYRAPFLRSERSDVDDSSFFLSPQGAKDPEAELRATLGLILNPALANARHGPVEQTAYCAFPARIAFLKRALGVEFERALSPDIRQECAAYTTWSQGIRARGVSLVFSSAYPNNPASMFGHTFLRLDRARPEIAADTASGIPFEKSKPVLSKSMDLLSYGVNFSAIVAADENPVKYAIWGLVGGYTGRFDLSPYYRKVNEYSFSESRDLWEYRLSMSEEEVAQLVRHVWELYAQGALDYYFLDENCSFQILTALEAVKPDWDLSTGFLLSAIPVETVKHVADVPGAVVSVGYRPSLRNEMAASLARLTSEERRSVERVFRGKRAVGPELSTSALDALIAVFSYEKQRAGKDEARGAILQSILLERSRRGKTETPELRVPEAERPDLSHRSSRFSLSGGSTGGNRTGRDGSGTWGISLYGFRHDFLDRTPSYNLFSEVRLLGFRGEKLEGRSFRFEQADFLAMTSMTPDSEFDAQKSWRVGVDWTRIQENPALSAGTWRASGGYGLGWNLFGPRGLGYVLAAGEFEKSGAFHHGIRFSPGADIGVTFNPVADRYFVQARVFPSWDAFAASSIRRFRLRGEISQSLWLTREMDLRFNISVERSQLSVREWTPRIAGQLGWRF